MTPALALRWSIRGEVLTKACLRAASSSKTWKSVFRYLISQQNTCQALPIGYVELAGMLRRIEWKGVNDDEFDLSGGATGWELYLTTNIDFGENDVFRGGVVYGEGIQIYMNDAPVDISIRNNFSNPV